jgi:hypothetical protein
LPRLQGSGLPGGFGDELAQLLFYLGGLAFGAFDLSGFIFFETHDRDKLFPAFDTDKFIGGHGAPPDGH